MRTVSIVTAIMLTGSVAAPSFALTNNKPPHVTPAKKKAKTTTVKPSWEQCFEMSITRGFNHEQDEWQQSIQDCLDGKIPL